MFRSSLALLLVSSLALAEPNGAHLYQPKEPETVGYPNWVLTPRGYTIWAADLARAHEEKALFLAENESLKKDLTALQSRPLLTTKAAAILIGAGVLVGALVFVPVGIALGKR